MSLESPWGIVDHIQKVAPGVAWVSTPGHGGLRISRELADRRFSPAARKIAIERGDWLWYEEDCDYAVAIWELPDLHHAFLTGSPGLTVENYRKTILLPVLSAWNLPYLLAIGVTPDPQGYLRWLRSETARILCELKDPDLIVTAWPHNASIPQCKGLTPAEVLVQTADSRYHVLGANEYNTQFRTPNLLSSHILIRSLPIRVEGLAGSGTGL